MSALVAILSLGIALTLQAGLSLTGPTLAHAFDPFLIVVVFFALRHGDTGGMLAGAAAGWIQDLHFGGPVLGLSALSKLVVGFCVGVVAARLLLTGRWGQLLLILGATLMDVLLFERLVAFFDVPAEPVSITLLLARATVTAAVGTGVLAFVDRRILTGERR